MLSRPTESLRISGYCMTVSQGNFRPVSTQCQGANRSPELFHVISLLLFCVVFVKFGQTEYAFPLYKQTIIQVSMCRVVKEQN